MVPVKYRLLFRFLNKLSVLIFFSHSSCIKRFETICVCHIRYSLEMSTLWLYLTTTPFLLGIIEASLHGIIFSVFEIYLTDLRNQLHAHFLHLLILVPLRSPNDLRKKIQTVSTLFSSRIYWLGEWRESHLNFQIVLLVFFTVLFLLPSVTLLTSRWLIGLLD